MTKIKTWATVIGIAVIAALIALIWWSTQSPELHTSAMKAESQRSVPATKRLSPASSPATLEDFLANAPSSVDVVTGQEDQNTRAKKITRLKEIQKKFQALSADGKTPDIREVDRLLGELIEIEGSPIIAGVDLSVLRNNLQVAQEVQTLAKALENESKQPSPDEKKIAAIVEQMQALQKQLRTDIMAKSVPTAPSKTPPKKEGGGP